MNQKEYTNTLPKPKEIDKEYLEWSLKPRYERYVVRKDGCWDWTGSKTCGYGKVGRYLAHRLSWIIHFGPIPPNMLVLHNCHNRSCSNPQHLHLGTDIDNTRDKQARIWWEEKERE